MQFKGDRVYLTEETFGVEPWLKPQLKWKDNKHHTKGLFAPKQKKMFIIMNGFTNS